MTIAVSATTEAATKPTERRDNEDDDEDESSDMSLSSPRFRAPTSVIL
jgi:hypothetical protein